MKVNNVSNQSFGKLYANKKDLNAELKKLDPSLRHMARRAIKEMHTFNNYDMYIGNGEIKVLDKEIGEDFPIFEKKSTKNDKGMTFYSALKYAYGKESLDVLTETLTNSNPALIGTQLAEKLESILKQTAIYGSLKTLQNIVANGIPLDSSK